LERVAAWEPNGIQEVARSIRVSSTNKIKDFRLLYIVGRAVVARWPDIEIIAVMPTTIGVSIAI
jgi:hypothetical protein